MSRTALFVRWVLGIIATIFLLLGVAYVAIPTNMIGAMDITAEPGKALADVRAVYGGLDLAVGILLFVCFFRKHLATGLAVGALTLTCMFGARLVGILMDPAQDVLTIGLFASEVLGAVLCAVGWFLVRQPETEPAAVAATGAPVATAAKPDYAAETTTNSTDTDTNP